MNMIQDSTPPRQQLSIGRDWFLSQLIPDYDYDSTSTVTTNEYDQIPFPNYPQQPQQPDPDDTLALLLPLLILLTTLLFLLLIFLLFLIFRRTRSSIHLREEGGPTNLEHEDQFFDNATGGLDGLEQRWLDDQENNNVKLGYQRAKLWQSQYPPNSLPTDITLSQFLSIQEKGVSAWSFEPDYESNPALIVQSRTEITFLADGIGMTDEEGGGCCVQSNLPLPKLNEVYYWECKMYEKPPGTTVSIGLATKPFPSFRLPGWAKYSVGYFSSDGFKSHSYPFTSQSYGPPLTEGDVLGVGYRPRTGTVFFTRNGKKLEDAFVGLNKHNLFPTVGANSACTIHVNLGQAGFVFIEANVKKWGLAPMMGTLAPPPAYGSERGSILLESAGHVGGSARSTTPNPPPLPPTRTSSSSSSSRHHRSSRRSPHPPPSPSTAAGAVSALATISTQPIRPSPLRHSRQPSNSSSSDLLQQQQDDDDENGSPRNPPTPGAFDVSLESLHRFPEGNVEEAAEEDEDEGSTSSSRGSSTHSTSSTSPTRLSTNHRNGLGLINLPPSSPSRQSSQTSITINPPAYNPVDPNRYPDGVAQAMLSDVFPGATSIGGGGSQRGWPAGLVEFQNQSGISDGVSSSASGRGYEAHANAGSGATGGGRSTVAGGSWWNSWFGNGDSSESAR